MAQGTEISFLETITYLALPQTGLHATEGRMMFQLWAGIRKQNEPHEPEC